MNQNKIMKQKRNRKKKGEAPEKETETGSVAGGGSFPRPTGY